MTLEEQLKRKILERYRSVRAFTNTIGVSYSTLDSALKREHGIKNAGICMMLKIFNALNLDIESVAEGTLRNKRSALIVTECTYDAAQIAAAYDKADEKSRKMARLALEDFMDSGAVPEWRNVPERVCKIPQDMTDDEIRAKLERQLADEKRRGDDSSDFGSGNSGSTAR